MRRASIVGAHEHPVALSHRSHDCGEFRSGEVLALEEERFSAICRERVGEAVPAGRRPCRTCARRTARARRVVRPACSPSLAASSWWWTSVDRRQRSAIVSRSSVRRSCSELRTLACRSRTRPCDPPAHGRAGSLMLKATRTMADLRKTLPAQSRAIRFSGGRPCVRWLSKLSLREFSAKITL